DVQPVFGVDLGQDSRLQAFFEVKTRSKGRRGQPRDTGEPISLYLTMRRYGPFRDLGELPPQLEILSEHAEQLAVEKLVPTLLQPIAAQIPSSQA
ncbi:MAG: hypothetical protein R3336_07625, partial [Phycisphaeraceae bacterium]|nr:hypothetical protein [Phycisphaeraceae bacterium]